LTDKNQNRLHLFNGYNKDSLPLTWLKYQHDIYQLSW